MVSLCRNTSAEKRWGCSSWRRSPRLQCGSAAPTVIVYRRALHQLQSGAAAVVIRFNGWRAGV
eukprot:5383505-Prymnesium_polylepis.1